MERSLPLTLRAVFLALVVGTGCASPRPPAEPPPYDSPREFLVTARVDGFKNDSAFIDFDNRTIYYHSIVLTVLSPDAVAWTRLHVQYQGLPFASSRRIELGDTLRFTVPVIEHSGCCGPYLGDLDDLEVVPRGSGS